MTAIQEREVDNSDIALIVRRAAEGDRSAWERLVDQYARLIWAITREFKLVESDAADVAQATWLRLLEHINRLERPGRVGSWLATTARHECLRRIAARKKMVLAHDDAVLDCAFAYEPDIDERLLAAERAQSVREALSCLPPRWQQLLEMLMADPPASYAEISDRLGLPVGSIGPTRGRCLARLRVLLQAYEPPQRRQRPAWPRRLAPSRERPAIAGPPTGPAPVSHRQGQGQASLRPLTGHHRFLFWEMAVRTPVGIYPD